MGVSSDRLLARILFLVVVGGDLARRKAVDREIEVHQTDYSLLQ